MLSGKKYSYQIPFYIQEKKLNFSISFKFPLFNKMNNSFEILDSPSPKKRTFRRLIPGGKKSKKISIPRTSPPQPIFNTRSSPILQQNLFSPQLRPMMSPRLSPQLLPMSNPRLSPQLLPMSNPRLSPQLRPMSNPRISPRSPQMPTMFNPQSIRPPPTYIPQHNPSGISCQICGAVVKNIKQHQKSKKCRSKNPNRSKSPSPRRKKKKSPRNMRAKTPTPVKMRSKSPSPVRGPTPMKIRTTPGVIFENIRPLSNKEQISKFINRFNPTNCTDDCSICLDSNDPSNSVVLRDCGHCFHKECIEDWFKINPRCPGCNHVYGMAIGNMPMGTMRADLVSGHVSGSHWNTIVITYDIPSGTQDSRHQNPGQHFSGSKRACYLEASPEGWEVLGLLKRAFEQGVTFTVGDSLTTGKRDVIVWNGIHHKTNTTGGPTSFGFPDPDYYKRVKDELAYKGIK